MKRWLSHILIMIDRSWHLDELSHLELSIGPELNAKVKVFKMKISRVFESGQRETHGVVFSMFDRGQSLLINRRDLPFGDL
jgi:hypothetical protein